MIGYIHEKQAIIRAHESAEYLKKEGYDLEIGWAQFIDKKTIHVNENKYRGKIVYRKGNKILRQDQDLKDDDRAITDENRNGHLSILMTKNSSLGLRRIGRTQYTFSNFIRNSGSDIYWLSGFWDVFK